MKYTFGSSPGFAYKASSVKVVIGGPAAPRAPRDPEADRRTLAAISELAQGGDMAAAIAQAEIALAGGLEHPLLLNFVALKLENEERLEEALAHLRRAQDLAPDDPGTLNSLGMCLRRMERPAEALAVFDRLADLMPDQGFVHANRGLTLEALGRDDWATEAYLRALEVTPGLPPARLGLASIASRRGKHAEAAAVATQVLALAPGAPEPSMIIARADLVGGALDEAEARMRRLVEDSRLSPVETANALNLLGDVLDARGQYLAAFDMYGACNRVLARHYGETHGAPPTPQDYARALGASLAQTEASDWRMPPSRPRAPDAPRAHVFLLGFPRSGTTLLESALTGSPDVEALEEQEALADGMRHFLRDPTDLRWLMSATEAELEPLRAAYWRRASEAGARPEGKVFLDRFPLNTLKLPLIAHLFPQARILFAVRDPRDVVLSCFRRRFQMNPSMFQFLKLSDAAGFYDAVMELRSQSQARLPLATHLVQHERLVADFDAETRAICDFIGLEWRDSMRDLGARLSERAISTPSTAQLARGLNAEGVGHWRRYADALREVEPVLAPWVERFGYEAA